MTTKKNLVKSMFMNILTAGIFATALTACSDEIDNEGASAPANTNSSVFRNLEQYSYAVPVQVNAQGNWKAEIKFEGDYHFCYLNRSEGHGPAMIKLCMLDNWTNERNNAQLVITDLENPQNTQIITLQQKCNLDNPQHNMYKTRGSVDGEEKTEENAPVKDKGDITTAVGYGYNVNMEPGVKAISSRPIIALEMLRDAGNGYGPVFRKGEFKINVESYAGNSIGEISETMANSANLKCTKSGFNAEASVTFTNTQKSSSGNLFCMTIANVNVGQAVLQGIDRNNVRHYMTEDAKRAIDGTGSAYPSTDAGFKQLIEDYGSHLILTTDLGGRLRYGVTIDRQYCSNTNELKAHASMGYKNKLMEANAKASEDYKSTYESKKSHIVRNVSAAGGGFKETAAVAANDTTDNVNEWINSLENEENLAVINFNQQKSQQLWPLYDLIDTSTPEGQARHDKLMAYIEDGTMENDFYVGTETYAQDDVVVLSFPSDWLQKANGKRSDIGGTLIREARLDGKTVAWYCMEYIPQISNEGLVPVVYPVTDNRPNFQAGRFLGTDRKTACDISWGSNGKVVMSNYATDKGQQSTLYLRANRLFTVKPMGIVENAETRNMYLTGKKATSDCNVTFGITGDDREWYWSEGSRKWRYKNADLKGLSYDNNYQYPLVKVGNQVWTRENFNGNVPHGSAYYERFGSRIENGEAFFTFKSLGKASFPAGWHVGQANDYQGLMATMSSDGVDNKYGERMQEGGASGFELKWTGWYVFTMTTQGVDALGHHKEYCYHNYEHKGNGTAAEYLLPGKGHIRIRPDKFEVCANEKQDYWAMQIRLVMDL